MIALLYDGTLIFFFSVGFSTDPMRGHLLKWDIPSGWRKRLVSTENCGIASTFDIFGFHKCIACVVSGYLISCVFSEIMNQEEKRSVSRI